MDEAISPKSLSSVIAIPSFKLRLPHDGAYPITQHFGESPEIYGPIGYDGHHGVDIGLPMRTPVLASQAGVIAHTGPNDVLLGAGIYVLLSHGDQYQTVYMHLDEVAPGVHRGIWVAEGELIGLSGNTGSMTTGPHLHWGLRDLTQMANGYRGYVNPLDYLA